MPDSFGGLFARYAAGVSGADPSAGAPWVGLVWAASLLTLGHPDLIVSLVLLGAVPVCFLSVSYTHLDVYKRQSDDNASNALIQTLDATNNIVLDHSGSGQLIALLGVSDLVIVQTPDAILVATKDPVSYTHLDVYKRQPTGRRCS